MKHEVQVFHVCVAWVRDRIWTEISPKVEELVTSCHDKVKKDTHTNLTDLWIG